MSCTCQHQLALAYQLMCLLCIFCGRQDAFLRAILWCAFLRSGNLFVNRLRMLSESTKIGIVAQSIFNSPIRLGYARCMHKRQGGSSAKVVDGLQAPAQRWKRLTSAESALLSHSFRHDPTRRDISFIHRTLDALTLLPSSLPLQRFGRNWQRFSSCLSLSLVSRIHLSLLALVATNPVLLCTITGTEQCSGLLCGAIGRESMCLPLNLRARCYPTATARVATLSRCCI